jgi:hypothetical protein
VTGFGRCAGPNSGRICCPDQILIVIVAELTLYGFRRAGGGRRVCRIVVYFGEGWRGKVVRGCVTWLGDSPSALGSVGIAPAKWRHALRGGRSFLVALQGLVSLEQAFEDGDGGAEVVAEDEEQVDVVEVRVAPEAVGEVVAWIDGGEHFAAAWAEEAEVAFARFRGRPVAAEGGNGDGHGQVVAKAA